MWEIKKVNLWDYKPKPLMVMNENCYLWCLFKEGVLKGESWGFAIHDKKGNIIQGSDHDAIYSLLYSIPKGEDVKLYGPFESIKNGDWNRSTPIDENGGHTMIIKPETWLRA
jgi:hypothetical protein